MGNPSSPGILEEIMDSSEGINFRASLEGATHAQEVIPAFSVTKGTGTGYLKLALLTTSAVFQ